MIERLEDRIVLAIDLYGSATQPITYSSDTTWNEDVIIHGDVTVRIDAEHSLTADSLARIRGNNDSIPDSLTLDVGGLFTLRGQIAGGGLEILTVDAGGRLNELTGPAIFLEDRSSINLPGATVSFATTRGVDMSLIAATPFFKDKSVQTGIEVGDMDITAANVAFYSNATTTKFADFVIDQVALAVPDLLGPPVTTASYAGPVTFVQGQFDATVGMAETDSIVRTSGSWITDGFKEGQAITIPAGETNAGTYLIETVDDLELELTANDSLLVGGSVQSATIRQEEQVKTVVRSVSSADYGTLKFTKNRGVDSATGEALPPILERTTGSWITDRFQEDFAIRVAGDGGMNAGKTFTVTIVDDLILTLDVTDEANVTFESGVTGYTVSQTQNLPNVPLAAVDSSRTMAPGTPVIVKNLNTLTRLSGDWATDGFVTGDQIAIEDSTLGLDGTYLIDEINGADLVLSSGDTAFPLEFGGVSRTVSALSPGASLTFAPGSSPTITRDVGDWTLDGFVDGDLITVSNTAAQNGSYKIASVSVDGKVMTLATGTTIEAAQNVANATIVGDATLKFVKKTNLAGNPTLTFTDNADLEGVNDQPDTIVRSTGSWTSDGFRAGQMIVVVGTGLNNQSLQIASISADGLTITLHEDDVAQNEANVSGARIVGLDTIVRTSGLWVDDGFYEQAMVQVAGAGSNNGTYRVTALSADGRSLSFTGEGSELQSTTNTPTSSTTVNVADESIIMRVVVQPPSAPAL